MCGIAGIYNYATGKPASRVTLAGMLSSLLHRGPDDEGIRCDGDLAIGMRRLSIIDLSGGRQPMASEDGTIWCVCNGEIYNFQELRSELGARGHRFVSRSDTEALLHAYEEWGVGCLERLRGMFGFAVWDGRQRALFVARDRLGIKPVYYVADGARLIFASEIKAILREPTIEPELDPTALGHYLSLKYVPAPLTMFKGIHSLPPGHLLRCDRKGITLSRYWDLPAEKAGAKRKSEAAYAEELESLLRESIKLHVASDVPFGAFLSGGLDSSTIVALMTDHLRRPVKTFSVGFTGGDGAYSELPYARIVARAFESEHHEVHIGAQDFIDRAEAIVWHLDQPIADDACLANFMVAELASRHVKMVLTGEGGDELFAGYARYSAERLAPLFCSAPAWAKQMALACAHRIPGLRRPKLALNALCQTEELDRFVEWFALFDHGTKQRLLSRDFSACLNGASPMKVFASELAHANVDGSLARMLYVDTKLWLPDDLLARGDKMAMAASVEARVPLLDHPLVEFAAKLPADLKLRGFQRKYLLKAVSRNWLPAAIIRRKKKGFPVPVSAWFRGDARDFLRGHLAGDTTRRRGLFDPPVVERLILEHESGVADHGSRLWGLLAVELWHRTFIDRRNLAVPRSISVRELQDGQMA